MNKLLAKILGISWMGFIGYNYFVNHQNNYLIDKGLMNWRIELIVLTFLLFIGFLGGVWIWNILKYNRNSFNLKIRPIWLLGLFNLFLVVVAWILYGRANISDELTLAASMWHFLSIWLPLLLLLGIIVFATASSGYLLLKSLKINLESRSTKSIVAITTGLSILILLLGIAGQLGLYTLEIVGVLILMLALLGIKSWKQIIADMITKPIEINLNLGKLGWIAVYVIFFMLALNIIDLLRPFPIGWDDLGVYMNYPKQIAQNSELLANFPNQALFVLTGIGFLLTPEIATTSMFISLLLGLLAIVAVYSFVNDKLKDANLSLVAAGLVYSMPMYAFETFLDVKTDPAVLLFVTVGLMLIWRSLSPKVREKSSLVSKDGVKYVFLGALILGMGLTVKINAAIAVFVAAIFICWSLGGWTTGLAMFFLLNAIYFLGFVSAIDFSSQLKLYIALASIVLGVLAFGLALKKRENIVRAGWFILVLILGSTIMVSPWIVKHYNDTGGLSIKEYIGGEAITTAPDLTSLDLDIRACSYNRTATIEEKGRYIGNTMGISKYLKLPWSITMNTQIKGYGVQVGFIWLAVLPLLLVCYRRLFKSKILVEALIMLIATVYFWLFIAFGIIWYGIFAIPLMLIILLKIYTEVKSKSDLLSVLITLIIIITFLDSLLLRQAYFANANNSRYALGALTTEDVYERTFPYFPEISEIVNQDIQNTTYRIGTFMPYFVEQSRDRLTNDNQLDYFNCINEEGDDHQRTSERFKKLGYKYILFDTKTDTLEKDQNGTLHQKTDRFKEFAKEELKLLVPETEEIETNIKLYEIPE